MATTIPATFAEGERLQPTWQHMEVEQAFAGLIDGCIAGERRSQQRVYELFYGKMMAVCLRYTKNHDQAKDILQDGFIKVFRSMDRFNRAGSFEGWIRRIMVNTAIDHFRRAKHAYLLLGEERSIEDFAENEEDDLAEDEQEEELDLKPADVINAMQKDQHRHFQEQPGQGQEQLAQIVKEGAQAPVNHG
jgi:RNA polymerase sigma factor (sigma-70 family)